MASPLIINRRPDEGDTNVSTSTPFRFGVRDLDTRADLTTVYCTATFAKAYYVPDEDLPSEAAALDGADITLAMFDDASGTTDPSTPCDQTLTDVGGTTVYRIEKSGLDGTPQEGVLYITLPAQATPHPYSARATLDLAFVTADPDYAYTTVGDFVGVVVGLVYWPENTGIFLFFRDDGVTKCIDIVGPSTDGVGTRSVSTTAVYDWSAKTTYSIHLDPSVYARAAKVLATAADGTETLLAEVDLDAINEFLPSVRMGDLDAESRPMDRVTMVVGLDGVYQGNYIDIYDIAFANFGRVLLHNGTQTGASSVETLPSEVIEVVGTNGVDEWSADGASEAEITSTAFKMTASAAPAVYRRDEPDLASGEWLVIARIAGENASHAGVYYTGMGVMVEDGTRRFKLSLLDDFSAHTIGVDHAGAEEDAILVGYHLPADAVEWEDGVSFTLLGSTALDALRLYLHGTDDVTAVVDESYGIGDSTTAARLSFGFIETGALSGDFYLVYLWAFPNCTFYEGVEATYPDAQGWTQTSAGGTRQLVGGSLEVDCTAAGAYDIYYIDDATYDETSGAAIIFKATISAWTDAGGAANPVRSEFGPVAAVRTSTVAVQVRFVVTDDGVAYVFLSNEESDFQDVIAQNTAGQAISAEVDLDIAHVYLLDVKPLKYVRLYLDYSTTPAVEVAWPASNTMRALPPNLPPTAVVAWGSLDEETGVKVVIPWFRASVGRGYDFKAALAVTEAERRAGVYGSFADVLVDVRDED